MFHFSSFCCSPRRSRRSAAVVGLALMVGLVAQAPPSLAAPRPDARVQEILDGNELFIDQKQASLNQLAFRPELITTRASRGSLAFSSGAQARINKNSQLRLGADCARLEQGQILISGKQNTCVGSVRMSVRGTHYLVEILEDGSTEVAVLDGLMTFTPIDPPKGAAATVVPESARREVLRFDATGGLVARRCLVADDYRRYLSGDLLQGFFFPLPEVGALANTLVRWVPGSDQLLGLLRLGGNRGLLPFLPF